MAPGRPLPADLERAVAEVPLGRRRSLLDPAIAEQWNNPKLLTQLAVPTLILWTRYNPGQLVPLAEEGAALIPNSELIVLQNSAHWPQWEEPGEFNRVHIEYLLK